MKLFKKLECLILEKALKKIFVLFILIQPFLDIYYLYSDNIVNIFKFSPATIMRILIIFVLGVLFLFCHRKSKINYFIIIYAVLIGVYFVFHHMNAQNFHSLVPGNFNYSLFSELFYVIRMTLPLIILVVSYYQEITDNLMEVIVSTLVALVSGSIVITNILKISLASYTNLKITGSIFDWFSSSYAGQYFELASKGFFSYANAISALAVLLTPLMFYFLIKRLNAKNIILMLTHLLAMFMLGTKVASLGFVGILVVTIGMYFFFSFIKKEFKFNNSIGLMLLLMVVLSGLILPFSPTMNRNNFDQQVQSQREGDKTVVTERNNKLKTEEKKTKDKEHKEESPLVKYIREHYVEYSINGQFIEVSYPYVNDPKFWFEVMQLPIEDKLNFRNIETLMLQRVKEINNNPKDNWFGITYTRMNNIFNLERDFQSHYFSMGIIGVLLLLVPYLLILLFSGILMLIKFKEQFTFKNCSLLLSVLVTLSVSLYSGNVMDFLTVTIILAFVEGQLLRNVLFSKSKKNKKISVIMPSYNDAETIEASLNSVKSQNYDNWEIIVVDDGSTDNTKNKIDGFCQLNHYQEKIHYYYQENSDQLNALQRALEHTTGDYIFILHSDDMLANKNVFKMANNQLNQTNSDALIADLELVNDEGKKIGKQRVLDYYKSNRTIATQVLWLGRNLFVDVAFWQADVFKNVVSQNYLKWNTPHWLDLRNGVETLSVENVSFPFIKYRIHENNYINSEIGELNVLNGEIRTLTRLFPNYKLPFYNKQYTIFRVYNKLKLLSLYTPFYLKKPENKEAQILKFVINKRMGNDFKENLFLNSVVEFYEKQNNREIVIKNIDLSEKIYLGSDMRAFNKNLIENKLSEFYLNFLSEMEKGFNQIRTTELDAPRVKELVTFMCIDHKVKIIVE